MRKPGLGLLVVAGSLLASCGGTSATVLNLHFIIATPIWSVADHVSVDVSSLQQPFADQAPSTSSDVTVSASHGVMHVTVTNLRSMETQFDAPVQPAGITTGVPVNFEAWAYDAGGHEIAKVTPSGVTLMPGQTAKAVIDLSMCEVFACAPYVDAGPPEAASPDEGVSDAGDAGPADAGTTDLSTKQ
jgi:hypothetical protein